MTPIERAALELHAGGCADDECDGSDLGGWESDAHAALDAALDVEELARVLRKRLATQYPESVTDEHAANAWHLAAAIREHLLTEEDKTDE